MRKSLRTALLSVSSSVLLLLSACTINIESADSHGDHVHSDQMSGSDSMFAEMMIPHHQQAIDMSTLALTQSSNEDVLALAQGIINAQEQEIALMENWTSGETESHMDHEMGGMASEEEMKRLATLISPEFDQLFLELMIKHHEGAIDMVTMIENSTDPEVKKLGSNIQTTQRAEIELMKKLLTDLRNQ